MNLPIEVMQQRGDLPLLDVSAESLRVSEHARFHGQRMLAQALRLGELTQNVPGLFAVNHRQPSYPRRAPFRVAGGAEAVTVALGSAHCSQAGGRAGFELDQAWMMAGAADDARSRRRNRLPRQRHVAVLFILVTEVGAFDAAMQRGAFHARREVHQSGSMTGQAPSAGKAQSCARRRPATPTAPRG